MTAHCASGKTLAPIFGGKSAITEIEQAARSLLRVEIDLASLQSIAVN